mmetsp:Transcript_58204/g.142303  ORF Transcript_58204/g.142303 Transcript_58204/m.142303 type:complete len:700 (+) Transcript_58204:470-2569(+)
MDASESAGGGGATMMLRRILDAVVGRELERNSTSVFQTCSEQYPGANTTVLLQCVSDQLESVYESNDGGEGPWSSDLVSFLLTLSGALIFFMQTGFAMLCAGCVRLKNLQNTMMKNLLDACGAAVAFFLIGYTLAYGGQYTTSGTTFVGSGDWFGTGPSQSPAYWFFEYTFSATSVTIVAGTLAERCQMAAYLCYSVVLSGIIYPIVAHQAWSFNGFLSNSNPDGAFLGSGVIDFAGSGVVHLTGGATALYATKILGARRGRFYDEHGELLERPRHFPGHSVSLQLLGMLVLWFGWYGFNCGSALNLLVDERGEVAANAAKATTLSAAGGGITSLFTNLVLDERRTGEYHFVMLMAINGCLSGLVAITSGCSVVEPWAALVIGMIAGLIYLGSSKLLERFRIDDAVDAIPVHMCNGAWGLIATGLLASPRRVELTYGSADHVGLFYSFARDTKPDFVLLACQLVLLIFIIGWTFCTMAPFFLWLNYRGWFRADSYEELIGLDISYHGGGSVLNSMTVDDGVGITFVDERRKEAKEEAHRLHSQYTQNHQIPNPSHRSSSAPNEIELGSGQTSTQQTYPMQFEDPSYDYPANNNHGYDPQQEQEEAEEGRIGGEYDYNINEYDQQEVEEGYENSTPLQAPIQTLDGQRRYAVESMEDSSSNSLRPAVEDPRQMPAGLTVGDDVATARADYSMNTTVIYEP